MHRAIPGSTSSSTGDAFFLFFFFSSCERRSLLRQDAGEGRRQWILVKEARSALVRDTRTSRCIRCKVLHLHLTWDAADGLVWRRFLQREDRSAAFRLCSLGDDRKR